MLHQLVVLAPWRQWTLASFLARVPASMVLLGLVLGGEHATGSLATGVQLAGTMVFTAGILGPWRGRWLDRREIRGALQQSCVVLGLGLAAFTVVVALRAPTVVLFALALFCGFALAGMWGGFRALLLVVVTPGQLRHAHFVESLMVEVSYLIGPLAIGIIVSHSNPVVGMSVMPLFAWSAALALHWVAEMGPTLSPPQRAPWRTKPVAAIYLFRFCIGLGVGGVEGNVASRMSQYGLASSSAGLFLSVLAVGSCVGGLWVSTRPLRTRDSMRLAAIMLLVFAAMIVPSALAPSALLFGVCLLFASLMLAPLSGLGAAELEARVRTGQRAEAFSYFMAATLVGGGLGTAMNGILINHVSPIVVPLLSATLYATLGVTLLGVRIWIGRRSALER